MPYYSSNKANSSFFASANKYFNPKHVSYFEIVNNSLSLLFANGSERTVELDPRDKDDFLTLIGSKNDVKGSK